MTAAVASFPASELVLGRYRPLRPLGSGGGEPLAVSHPFWSSSPIETARRIEEGPPRLEAVRPDLPRHLTEAVARATAVDPVRRPSAVQLADRLRATLDERERRQKRTSRDTAAQPPRRAIAAARAAGFVGGAG